MLHTDVCDVEYLSAITTAGYYSIGHYSIEQKSLNFHSCRERFASVFNKEKITTIYMTCTNVDQFKFVADFMENTEKILGLKNFSEFWPTNKNILKINPSFFWRSCFMRRSLLTILLRVGLKYKKPSEYEKILFEDIYLHDTKRAVERFFYGFTTYSKDPTPDIGLSSIISFGWRSAFYRKDIYEIKKLLVKGGETDSVFVSRPELWL